MQGFPWPCFCLKKNEVIALDIAPKKIEQLNHKISPVVDREIQVFQANKDLNFVAILEKALAYKNTDFMITAL